MVDEIAEAVITCRIIVPINLQTILASFPQKEGDKITASIPVHYQGTAGAVANISHLANCYVPKLKIY